MNTETKQFTRQDYLNKVCAHREYYAQFVNNRIVTEVGNFIGVDLIKKAISENDTNLNAIPLNRWDAIGKNLASRMYLNFRQLGDIPTLSGGVCIAKEAARQIFE
jgi:hypothetical protein